jgi:hypothetical protein
MLMNGYERSARRFAGLLAAMTVVVVMAATPQALAAPRLLGETRLSFHENDLDVLRFSPCATGLARAMRRGGSTCGVPGGA